MTDEELNAFIEAIRSALDVGDIEERIIRAGEWHKPREGSVSIDAVMKYEYRIKSDPLEVWIDKRDIGLLREPRHYVLYTKKPGDPLMQRLWTKFREVIE